MAKDWTYSPKLSSNLDKVRFLIGDVKEVGSQVKDVTINAALALKEDNVYRAAAYICEGLAARFTRVRDRQRGGGSSGRVGVSRIYAKMAIGLKRKAMTGDSFVMPSMTEATKKANRDDTSLTHPTARRGLHDNPTAAEPADSDSL